MRQTFHLPWDIPTSNHARQTFNLSWNKPSIYQQSHETNLPIIIWNKPTNNDMRQTCKQSYETSLSSIWGTAQAIFAVDRAVDQDRKWRRSHDRKWRQSCAMSGSMFRACATGSRAISALVGPFDRKWQSHVTGRGHVRKWPWPEVGSAHSRLFPALFS